MKFEFKLIDDGNIEMTETMVEVSGNYANLLACLCNQMEKQPMLKSLFEDAVKGSSLT